MENSLMNQLKTLVTAYYEKSEVDGYFDKATKKQILSVCKELGIAVENTYPFNFRIKYVKKYEGYYINEKVNCYIQNRDKGLWLAIYNGLDGRGENTSFSSAKETNITDLEYFLNN